MGGAGGHTSAYGLVVNFDNYQNSTADPRSIEIFSDSLSVGNFLATGLPGEFHLRPDIPSHLSALGLDQRVDLTYGGQVIFNDLPTPGFFPQPNANFAFNAATGGSMGDAYIDNIVITTAVTAHRQM